MDDRHFDTLTRALGRRRLTTLGLGGLAAAVGLSGAATDARKKKGKKKNKKKNKNENTCPAGSAPCGAGCCPGDLLHYCCGGKSCCTFEQGCSASGLCSDCGDIDHLNLPGSCIKAVCDNEGRLTFVAEPAGTPCRLDPGDPTSTICPNGTPAECTGGVDGDGSCGCRWF